MTSTAKFSLAERRSQRYRRWLVTDAVVVLLVLATILTAEEASLRLVGIASVATLIILAAGHGLLWGHWQSLARKPEPETSLCP